MFLLILKGAPLWVWPLFAGLVFLGLRAARPRRAHVYSVYLMPLFGFISLLAVARLPLPGLYMPAYLAAYLIGIIFGYRIQAWCIVGQKGPRLILRAEWFTLFVLMTVFCCNFLAGSLRAIEPEIYASEMFNIAFPLVVGLCSGSFLGRALYVFWHIYPFGVYNIKRS